MWKNIENVELILLTAPRPPPRQGLGDNQRKSEYVRAISDIYI
jgi:hypothetical protein